MSASNFFRKPEFMIVALFILTVFGIATGGHFYYIYQKQMIREERCNDLKAIATLKIAQIVRWKEERIADASVITNNPFVYQAISAILAHKNPVLHSDLKKFLQLIVKSYHYYGICFVNKEGRSLFSIDSDPLLPTPHILQTVALNYSDTAIHFSGFIFSSDSIPVLTIDIPIFTQKKFVGTLLLHINPYDFLFPFVQEWPTPSKTSETLICSLIDNHVVYINPLPHHTKRSFELAIPLTRKNVAAVMAINGQKGFVDALDYRDHAVIAYLSDIPGTNWFMVAKTDKSEIFVPMQHQAIIIVIIILLFIVAVSIIFYLLFRNFLSSYFLRQASDQLGLRSTHDIFDRKQKEEQIIQINRELEERVNKRTHQLKRVNEDLRSFSYSVSHDLKAPLRSIGGFSHMLKSRFARLFDTDGLHYLDNIIESVQNMNRLIDDLLRYSQIDRADTKLERVDLESVFSGCLDNLASILSETDASITFSCQHLFVKANKVLLNQVFTNLLSNSLLYQPKGQKPVIHIFPEENADQLILCFRDNGIGIDPQFQEKIFQVFERLHTNTEYPGTGIGLAIVKRAMEVMHGNVWISESIPGKGSVFCIALTKSDST